MDSWQETLQVVAPLMTCAMFASSLRTMKAIREDGSVKERSGLPHVVLMYNCIFWSLYGLSVSNPSIITPNLFGVCMSVYYVATYYKYSSQNNKTHFTRQVVGLACLAAILLLYANTFSSESPEKTQDLLGLFSCTFTVATFASPLVVIKQVLSTKNTDAIGFDFAVMSFIASGLWVLYGYTIADYYVLIPNVLGFIFAVSQLSLFIIFPSVRKNPLSPRTLMV